MTFKAIFFRAAQGKKSVIRRGEDLMQNLMLNKLISILSSIQFNFQRQEQGAHTAYRGKLFWKKTTYLCTAAHLMFAYSHLRNMETKKNPKT